MAATQAAAGQAGQAARLLGAAAAVHASGAAGRSPAEAATVEGMVAGLCSALGDRELGKAIPYGIYDVGRDTGWVSVGDDHDTAAFAVETLRRWWHGEGRAAYPDARQLLISADGGGSNGYRARLWKYELGKWAQEEGLAITVCHLPPGTSKWNKIEHRLFAHISMNWRGRPLTSHDVVVDLIGATTTQQGLKVHAERDQGVYPLHIAVSDAELAEVHVTSHQFHGEWNYDLLPTALLNSNH